MIRDVVAAKTEEGVKSGSNPTSEFLLLWRDPVIEDISLAAKVAVSFDAAQSFRRESPGLHVGISPLS